MCLACDLVDVDVGKLCFQKWSGGKNTLCVVKNCDIDHRNQHVEPVQLHKNDMLMLKHAGRSFFRSHSVYCEFDR